MGFLFYKYPTQDAAGCHHYVVCITCHYKSNEKTVHLKNDSLFKPMLVGRKIFQES